jgi:hypothetical protein
MFCDLKLAQFDNGFAVNPLADRPHHSLPRRYICGGCVAANQTLITSDAGALSAVIACDPQEPVANGSFGDGIRVEPPLLNAGI